MVKTYFLKIAYIASIILISAICDAKIIIDENNNLLERAIMSKEKKLRDPERNLRIKKRKTILKKDISMEALEACIANEQKDANEIELVKGYEKTQISVRTRCTKMILKKKKIFAVNLMKKLRKNYKELCK